jgi:OmpA-OmpF porin, OOP family
MADSLLASLFGMLDSRSISGIAGALGASEQSVTQGLKSSIASLLGGMASKSEDPAALRNMLDLAPSAAGDMTLSQVARAASDPSSPIISGGKRLVSALFGSAEPALTNGVSAASGLRANTTSTVLALAAPMVMSFLSKRVRTDGMDMRGLSSLLQRESGAIRNALPAGVADIIWPSTVRAATPVVAQTIEKERSSFNWLPLLALVALIPLILWLVHQAHKPVVPAVAPVTTETTPLGTANRAVMGSVDMVKRALMNKTDLRFDTGSEKLRPESQAMLDNIAVILKRYPDVRINVAGYTDNVGSPDKNLQLSQKRANTVVAELVQRGVPADCLTAAGYGEENPIADNSTAVGRASNRRVSLDIRQP